jgi:hypothetical protein
VHFLECRLDVFLPLADFYRAAKERRRRMPVGNSEAWFWDAETLCVFKMMFFRGKDLVDLRSLMRGQGASLDSAWIESSLMEMYGKRDPRLTRWRELVDERQSNQEWS